MATDASEAKGMNKRFVRGFPMPGAPWFNEENMEAAMDYVPLDGDIVLCSYPKTGTTWMTYIVWGILHRGESYPSLVDSVGDTVPFLEFNNCVETVKKLPQPRFYKHHFPLTVSQWNPKAKYICVYRHPEDVIASYFPFSKETSGNDSSLDTFFEHFLTGNVAYGNYFDHVSSFLAHEEESNLLMVSYEELKGDIRSQVLRIAKFLGDTYHRDLMNDEPLIDKIIEATSFDYMKKNLKLKMPVPGGDKREITLIRKGQVGEGKKLLSEQQRALLKKAVQEKFQDTDILKHWYGH